MALPIIMGQNIGTCVTAVLSSIGVSRNAKKVAVVHLSFNIIGTTICLVPFCLAKYLVDIPALDASINPFMIAVMHSIFNIFTTVILLPFTKQLEMIANKVYPEVEGEAEPDYDFVLDERLLAVPALAIKDSNDAVVGMCHLSSKAFKKAAKMVGVYTEEEEEKIHSEKSGKILTFPRISVAAAAVLLLVMIPAATRGLDESAMDAGAASEESVQMHLSEQPEVEIQAITQDKNWFEELIDTIKDFFD